MIRLKKSMVPGTLLFLFLILPFTAYTQSDEDCMMCHSDDALTAEAEDGSEISMYIDQEEFSGSIHGELEIACIDCHADLAGFEEFPHESPLQKVDCSICHDGAAESFHESIHWYVLEHGNKNGPTCKSCHGKHDILASDNQDSRTYKQNVPQTCASCHGGEYKLSEDEDIRKFRAYETYMSSVHGSRLASGNGMAANCIDCHGAHDLKGPADPKSKINKANIPQTCSQCHEDVYNDYMASIHGRAHVAGISDSPVCTDCHGEHSILSPKDKSAYTSKSKLSQDVCANCHEDERIITKYGLPSKVGITYSDSYHGLATRRGSVIAATCIDCHNSHLILPRNNPTSTINPDNITSTCGNCHENSTPNFAASYTHDMMNPDKNPINRMVRTAYISLIIVVIGGMLIHNALIVFYYMKRKYARERGKDAVKRFDGHFIFQHTVTALSFTVLVITGFALKYPDAFWAQFLTTMGMDEFLRGTIHRISGIILIAVGLLHVWYLLATRNGRTELIEMMPVKNDITGAIDTILYYIGQRPRKPGFSKYDYTEKAEYWALIWGTAIMGFTGFILWFPTFFAGYLPLWAINVAELFHFYEAWLATLAIIVWHFFFVIYHPDVYPMNFSWLTGKMDSEEAQKHYPIWYSKMMKSKETDEESSRNSKF